MITTNLNERIFGSKLSLPILFVLASNTEQSCEFPSSGKSFDVVKAILHVLNNEFHTENEFDLFLIEKLKILCH